MNPSDFTPKQRFLASKHADGHLKWSRSDDSRAAIEAALSYMAYTSKGANLLLLEGAARLAEILLDIAEPKNQPTRVDRSALENAGREKKT